jgi:hypothetical protein
MGGALYASDWASGLVQAAFGQRTVFATDVGKSGIVGAHVSDPYLAQIIGSNISIHFDMSNWDRIDRFPAWTDIYMWDQQQKPLVVGMKMGKGRIVYTSFHHHAQQQVTQSSLRAEEMLLQWLVTLPTQHGRMVHVGSTLARYRAAHNGNQVVNRLGAGAHVIPLKLGSKAGLGVFALSWAEGEQLEFAMNYLRNGEVSQASKLSSTPPLVMTVRNPGSDDTIEIRRSTRSALDGEQMHPYVFGFSIRRDLLGDPDWFALAVLRHIQRALVERNTATAAKALITRHYLLEVMDTILTGLGYDVSRQSEADRESAWPSLVARSEVAEGAEPDLQLDVRIIDRIAGPDNSRTRQGWNALEPLPQRNELTEGTERLLVFLAFSEVRRLENMETRSDPETLGLPAEFSGWRAVATENITLGVGQEILSAEEFNTLHLLNVVIYRLENPDS